MIPTGRSAGAQKVRAAVSQSTSEVPPIIAVTGASFRWACDLAAPAGQGWAGENYQHWLTNLNAALA